MSKVTQSPISSFVNSNSNSQRGAPAKPAKPLVDLATAMIAGVKATISGVGDDAALDGGDEAVERSKKGLVGGADSFVSSIEIDESTRVGGGELKGLKEPRNGSFVKGPICDKGSKGHQPKPIGLREHAMKDETGSGIRGTANKRS